MKVGGDTNNVVIGCPANESITVTAVNCWITVPSQTLTGAVTYTAGGSTSTRDFVVKVSTNTIHYTQQPKPFPGCSNVTHTTGSYVGEATVSGSSTYGVQLGI